jgi:hypothetical protein
MLLASNGDANHTHDVQDVKALFGTWVTAVPAFGNVGSLIGLVFFIYAYIGVNVFGQLRWNVGEAPWARMSSMIDCNRRHNIDTHCPMHTAVAAYEHNRAVASQALTRRTILTTF